MKSKIEIREDHSEIVSYDSPDVSVYIRRGLLSAFADHAADAHWHDDIELIAVLSGTMSYNVNGTIVRLGEGEGIFVNARQLHYGFSEERTECDFLCALLHPLSFCGGNGFAEKYILPTIGGGCPFLTFRRGGTLGELYEAVSALYELRKRPSFALHALGIGYGIWAALYGLPQIRQSARRPQYADLPELKGMLTYIHKHYDEKLTLEKIAAAGSMCKSSCAAVFKKYLRKTPVRYLIEYRLKKAAEQLTRTDKKIIEIGLEAGFSGVSYFIEAFRKQYGICPSEYKKRAGRAAPPPAP